MIITLCGSARFEQEFKRLNKLLTLSGHVVFSLAVYPSDEGAKAWYSEEQKAILDAVHIHKISHSDAIFVIAPGNYVGESTAREIAYALSRQKPVYCLQNIPDAILPPRSLTKRPLSCPY